jgi:hypothetical protein
VTSIIDGVRVAISGASITIDVIRPRSIIFKDENSKAC